MGSDAKGQKGRHRVGAALGDVRSALSFNQGCENEGLDCMFCKIRWLSKRRARREGFGSDGTCHVAEAKRVDRNKIGQVEVTQETDERSGWGMARVISIHTSGRSETA